MTAGRTVLSVRDLSKQFPGQRALDNVSLDLRAGEIHALVGENGSGKSTLIKCLAGYHEPAPGSEIILDGQAVRSHAAGSSREGGFAFVHQDLGLIPSLSVLENLVLGRGFKARALGRIRWRDESLRAQWILDEHGIRAAPDTLVRHLSLADQTLVAIARALANGGASARILVLDEPTAALPEAQVESLFERLRRLAERGVAILYVSHRLEELFQISQRVTVLRDGRRVGTFETRSLTEEQLVRHIVGGEPASLLPDHDVEVVGESLLKVRRLSGNRLRGATFVVRRGEILGVAGLLGSGRSELARLLSGAQRATAGEVELGGELLQLRSPADAIRAGVCLVPEDRRRAGAIQRMTLGENLTLTSLDRFTRVGTLRRRSERSHARALAREFNIRPPDPNRRFATLSGGNQQKGVLAKWLTLNPRLIVLDEPVKGVDVGARAEVYGLIESAAERGAGVVMVSSEVDDLTELCDRVLVLRAGSIVGELRGPNKTRENVMRLAFSGRPV